ncbi:MAG: glycosyltransferase family 2 protein [Candidatus Levybacteria bacterium]|nr:glycosyltransferase family 2 protein [Candidatus Levybacteria bacterium]
MKFPVSAVVLSHNNEASIETTLQSLSWSDDICVIDDYSTDGTLNIAAQAGVRIFQGKLQENFAYQRNFSLQHVKNDWVLFVDADEIVSAQLADEIRKNITDSTCVGYSIPRTTVWRGRTLRFGEFFNFSLIRLGKRTAGKWSGKVHEQWEIKGRVGKLHAPLLHFQEGGIEKLLKKINMYSSIRADELYFQKKQVSFFTILFLPMGKFFQNYIVKLGILDGTAGLINAIAMSFYTFLVRAKLWLLWHETVNKP